MKAPVFSGRGGEETTKAGAPRSSKNIVLVKGGLIRKSPGFRLETQNDASGNRRCGEVGFPRVWHTCVCMRRADAEIAWQRGYFGTVDATRDEGKISCVNNRDLAARRGENREDPVEIMVLSRCDGESQLCNASGEDEDVQFDKGRFVEGC